MCDLDNFNTDTCGFGFEGYEFLEQFLWGSA